MTDPALTLVAQDDQSNNEALASGALRPAVQAALSLKDFNAGPFPNLDLTALVTELGKQIKDCNDGDLSRAEASLVTQAHLLDAIFNTLARRAFMNVGEYMEATEKYLKLALKAQNQARRTWESLGRLKNPQAVAFVKQANIAQNQQINVSPESRHTEVLEAHEHEWLDPGTPQETLRSDSPVEAVGEVHRSENR